MQLSDWIQNVLSPMVKIQIFVFIYTFGQFWVIDSNITATPFSLLLCLCLCFSVSLKISPSFSFLYFTVFGTTVLLTQRTLIPAPNTVVLAEIIEEELEEVTFISANLYEVCTRCQVPSSSIHLFILTMMEIWIAMTDISHKK